MNNESEFTDEYVLKLQEENEKLHKELDYANNYNIYLIAKLDKIKEYCKKEKVLPLGEQVDYILELLEEIE